MDRGLGSVFMRFSGACQSGSARNVPRRVCEGVSALVLRLYGLAVEPYTLAITYTAVSRVNSAFPAIQSVSNINSAIISQYCGDVEAEINLYVGKRYALPLTVDCPILTAIATRETIYRIAVQRALVQFPAAQQGKAPLQVQHEDDQAMLKMIADGELVLISSSGDVISVDLSALQIYSTSKTYVPTFHEGPWTEQIQDSNKLRDIESERKF